MKRGMQLAVAVTLALANVAMVTAQTEETAATQTFDHAQLDTLLKKHVSGVGVVDYQSLQGDVKTLDAYLAQLKALDGDGYQKLDEDERLALLINAYNAFTLKLILEHYPIESITKIPEAKRWKDERWHVAGKTVSLDQLEHEWIRKEFKEARIHFAVNCASVGCPPLRAEAYTGAALEAQLADQARIVHNNSRWFKHHAMTGNVFLNMLYKWYPEDFKREEGSVLKYAAQYSRTLKLALEQGGRPKVHFIDWDWSLNDKR